MSYRVEVKALGFTSPDVIEKYEKIRTYIQGNFATVVKFLTNIQPTLSSDHGISRERTTQWVVSASNKAQLNEAIDRLDEIAKKYKIAGRSATMEYLLDGCGIDLTTENEFSITTNKINEELMQKLNENRKNNVNCDLEIKVGNETFHAHKIIMDTLSEYFVNCFQDHSNSIELNDIEPRIFGSILDFLYSGKLVVAEQDLDLMQKASDMLVINGLKEALKKTRVRYGKEKFLIEIERDDPML